MLRVNSGAEKIPAVGTATPGATTTNTVSYTHLDVYKRQELIASWSEIVGDETSAHSEPIGVEDGVLTVRCDSTAWATQLRLMRTQVTTTIAVRFPAAGIQSVRFEGPNAPSWKRGPRSIPGRGPRDTYG